MKILYVSQYFPPEMGAPSARAVELARHWVRAGHDVTVLTGFPNHPTGVVPPEWQPRLRNLVYREQVEGIRVVRTWLLPLPNRKAHERILNYGSFCVSAALRGLDLPRPDVVIATSPQLLVGLSGWWISFWKRVPFVFEVRDLWPESLSAVGMGQENSVLHRVLRRIAGFLYRKADHIVVVTPAFKDHLIRFWQVPPSKISIVQNGVETEVFHPCSTEPELKKKLQLEGKFVVGYIGTMGMAQVSIPSSTRPLCSRSLTPILYSCWWEKAPTRSAFRQRPRRAIYATCILSTSNPANVSLHSSAFPMFVSSCSGRPNCSKPSSPPRCWSSCPVNGRWFLG